MSMQLHTDNYGRITNLVINGEQVSTHKLIGLDIHMDSDEPTQAVLTYAPKQLTLELEGIDTQVQEGDQQEGADDVMEAMTKMAKVVQLLDERQRITQSLLQLNELEVDRLNKLVVRLKGESDESSD